MRIGKVTCKSFWEVSSSIKRLTSSGLREVINISGQPDSIVADQKALS